MGEYEGMVKKIIDSNDAREKAEAHFKGLWNDKGLQQKATDISRDYNAETAGAKKEKKGIEPCYDKALEIRMALSA